MLLVLFISTLVSSSGMQPPVQSVMISQGSAAQTTGYASNINGCTSQKLEGVQIAKANMTECQRKTAEATKSMVSRANEKATETFNKEMSKGSVQDGNQCIEKVTQGSDRCVLANIINTAVKHPSYNISEKANLNILSEEDKPIAAVVSVNYKVTTMVPEPKKQKTIVDQPADRSLRFNKLGQVLAAEGDFTPEEDKNSCKPCEKPEKKTVESASKACNLGCQLRGTSALVVKGLYKKETKRTTEKEKNAKSKEDRTDSSQSTDSEDSD